MAARSEYKAAAGGDRATSGAKSLSGASAAERLARLRLARTERVGPATYRRLLLRYGSAAAALEALPDIAATAGTRLTPLKAEAAEREFAKADKLGAAILFLGEPNYPPLLALLHDAPPVVAVLGDPAALSARAVAIVGSRNASAGGCLLAEQIGEGLAAAGVVVVSGMARGIDAGAHEGAMRAGRTVAVVAGGLDCPYPAEHAALQARIAANGAVVAEAPFGTAPQARHFPRRNRIIAGLALGVVVVEATPRSGSLITARLALEAGRELFAVPGSPLDPRSAGGNLLIRDGAVLTETAADVLTGLPEHPQLEGVARLPLFARDGREMPDFAPPAGFEAAGFEAAGFEAAGAGDGNQDVPADLSEQLMVLVSQAPVSVDDLVARCQVSAAAMNAALLELELAGRVTCLSGGRVALREAEEWPDPDPL